MPTCHHTYISDTLDVVRKLKPRSILDVGIGFGKWGLLFREYLDVMAGRVFPDQWQIKIDGIIYKPNGQGELYLPKRVEMANPVDEEEVVIKKPKKKKKTEE